MSNNLLVKSAIYISCFISFITISIRWYIWHRTESLTIFAILLDAILDFATTFMNIIAAKYAFDPPDNNHRFGHEKIQDLVIFAQSLLFFIFGSILFYKVITNLSHTNVIDEVSTSIYYILITIVFNLALVIYQSWIISKTGSNLIKADKIHYISDFLINLGALFAIFFSKKWHYIDIFYSICIVFYIFYTAYSLLKKSISNLIDEEFSNQEKQIILSIISKYKLVQGIHELKTRYAGEKRFIQFHLEFDGDLTLLNVHDISDNIEKEIKNHFPNSEIIIHQDPLGEEHDVKYREKIPK